MKRSKKTFVYLLIIIFLITLFWWPIYAFIQNKYIPILPRFKLSQFQLEDHAVNFKHYTINELPYQDLPQGYNENKLVLDAEKIYAPQDEKGICLLVTAEGKEGYTPLKTFRYLMVLLNNYRISGDQDRLEKFKRISDAIMLTVVESDGALFFPYTLDLDLHGLKKQYLKAPWYSGMAQGVGLSLYSRAYNITRDTKYLEIAGKIFRSFKNLKKNDNKPWVAFLDHKHYYWIEEYPGKLKDRTLNGFIYAIFGLYEYSLLDKSDESKNMLQAAITSVNNYLPLYRRKGAKSFYCLGHRERYGTYHKLHIKQLRQLFLLTSDGYFSSMASKFEADWNK